MMKITILALLANAVMSQSNLRVSLPQSVAKSFPPGMFKYARPSVQTFAGTSGEPAPYNPPPQAYELRPPVDPQYNIDRRAMVGLMTAGALGVPLGYPTGAMAAGSIPLVTFNGEKGTTRQWTITPKLREVGTFGQLTVKGKVSPPELKSNDIIIAYTIGNRPFPDISSCEGITFDAKSLSDYTSFSFSFGKRTSSSAPRSFLYKTDFKAPLDEFGTIKLPFKSFTDYSGAAVAPDAKTLKDIDRVTFWAEEGGTVNLAVGDISAYGCAAAVKLVEEEGEGIDGVSSFSWCLAAPLGLLVFFVMRSRVRKAPITPPLLG